MSFIVFFISAILLGVGVYTDNYIPMVVAIWLVLATILIRLDKAKRG